MINMSDSELRDFVDLIYEHIKSRLEKDGFTKSNVKRKNATVVSTLAEGESNINKKVEVRMPYDTVSFSIINKTGEDLNKYDVVVFDYSIDIKNGIAIMKVQ